MNDKNIKVFMLSGPAGSGKSECKKHLVDCYGFTPFKFAGRLKAMLYAIGLTEAHIEGHLKEVPCARLGGKTPRYAMQTLGTEWGRDLISTNMWTNLIIEDIREAASEGKDHFVLDDLRFLNEQNGLFKHFDCFTVHVDPTYPGYVPIALGNHPSEGKILGRNTTVHNYGTIDQLLEQIDSLVEHRYRLI